jgi:hypothetical protein
MEEVTFDLAYLKRLYGEARDNTDKARKQEDLCQDYYDNKQWTSEQIKVLRKRKQPEIWINRIAPAVNGILGVLEQGQTDPRAFPRTNEDNDAAEVATDSLRYAAEKSRWQRTKLTAAKNYLIGQAAAVIVEVNEELDPWPRIIRQGEFFYAIRILKMPATWASPSGCTSTRLPRSIRTRRSTSKRLRRQPSHLMMRTSRSTCGETARRSAL